MTNKKQFFYLEKYYIINIRLYSILSTKYFIQLCHWEKLTLQTDTIKTFNLNSNTFILTVIQGGSQKLLLTTKGSLQ